MGTLLRRGRSVLLAGDLDVVVVLTEADTTLRGRTVAARVSPVQLVAVLRVGRDG